MNLFSGVPFFGLVLGRFLLLFASEDQTFVMEVFSCELRNVLYLSVRAAGSRRSGARVVVGPGVVWRRSAWLGVAGDLGNGRPAFARRQKLFLL